MRFKGAWLRTLLPVPCSLLPITYSLFFVSVCIIDEPSTTDTDNQHNKDQQCNLYIRHTIPLLWLPAHVTDRRQQKYQVLWTL